MKKLIPFSAICIIACILFTSCGSSISITKRHYNNGYYIAYSGGKQDDAPPKEEKRVVRTETNDPLNSLKEKAEKNTLGLYSLKSPITESNDLVASNEKIEHKSISQLKLKQALKQNSKIIELPATQIKNRFLKSKKDSFAPMVEGGLSLFWLVILVVLILWALGFLIGGFGGLLNILLVIALILFILWLLKYL